MATLLGCHQSTISRELARSRPPTYRRYTAAVAQRHADIRRRTAYDTRPRWSDDPALVTQVLQALTDGHSPEQIAGRLRYLHRTQTVSHQTIYAYIARNKAEGGTLYTALRYQGKKFKWRGLGGQDRGTIPNRKGIEDRPPIVDQKTRFGDFESDLVVSGANGAGAVATYAERTSMYFKAVKVTDRSAQEFLRASHVALGGIPAGLRHTMTHDNGKEIAKHAQIAEELSIAVYCARPYHSWERGLNEWMNRELRRFFPKGTDFSTISQEEVDDAVKWLNNCPRKSLHYRTPQEVYDEVRKNMHLTL